MASGELIVHLEKSGSAPISSEVRAEGVRQALEAKNYSELILIGVASLGMASDRVRLSIEPDIEFLILFAQSVEAASDGTKTKPIMTFLDDGILELSAGFDAGGAWSRMGYLDAATTVRLSAADLVALWRGFFESLLRAC